VIEITVEIDNNTVLKSLSVFGHSGFNNKGNDIVCAGVSTLVQTMAISLNLLPDVDVDFEDNVSYHLKLKSFTKENAFELRGMTIFLLTGLKAISEKYNDIVKFSIIRS
jgi:uncharacterized protein